MKKYISIILALCLTGMTACGSSKASDVSNTDTVSVEEDAKNENTENIETDKKTDDNENTSDISDSDKTIINTTDIFSKRDTSDSFEESECEKITLVDGMSATTADGVNITGDTITIKKEGNYILTGALADGSIIVDAGDNEKIQLIFNGIDINNNTSAAIYIKSADKVFITLAAGTKNSLSNGGEFVQIDDNNIDSVIYSKDDLSLNGTGELTIKSLYGHGIVSKDDLVIASGIYNIETTGHGISGKDSVAIADGVFNIKTEKDAIHSINNDDAEKGWVYIKAGEFNLEAGSDGISALNEILIEGGKINISNCYEGIEARLINITGGKIDIISKDDGLNATDKRGQDNTASDTNEDNRGRFGGGKGGMDTQEAANICISGGIINIDAEGDGLDTNGYVTVSGGELYITGPSNGGNGALDYGIDATITGGIVVAAGQSQMAQNFGKESTQGSILVNTSIQQNAGSDIILSDNEDNVLIRRTMNKKFNSVVISCPDIVDKGVYTVKLGENTEQVTMDGLLYGEGDGGFPGGMHDFGERRGVKPPQPQDFH